MVSYFVSTFAFVVYGVGFLLIYDHGGFMLGYIARCIGTAMTCIGVAMTPFGGVMTPIGDTMASIGNVMGPFGDTMMARGRTNVSVNEHIRNRLSSFWAWLGSRRDASS